MTKMTFLRVAAAAILAQCSALALALDPLSYARYDQVKTSALHMDLKADFTKKTLSGFAELSLNWIDKSARTLDLDTRDLSISKVEAQDAKGAWKTVPYTLGKRDAEKGRAMHVKLQGQPQKVRIHYRTAPTATALQWLSPVQTMSGKRPYMFSQSQNIEARSWVPLQDTPAVRFTYTARIEAAVGGILASVVSIVVISALDLSWRYTLLFGVVSAGYGLIARRLIPESPRWLASRGRVEEADRVIEHISGIPTPTASTDREVPRQTFGGSVRELWAGHRSRLAFGMAALAAIEAGTHAPDGRGATVLYLSPTKALANDQLRQPFRDLSRSDVGADLLLLTERGVDVGSGHQSAARDLLLLLGCTEGVITHLYFRILSDRLFDSLL